MRLLAIDDDGATFNFTTDELMAITNGLNNSLFLMEVDEFQTRMGVEMDFARKLLDEILQSERDRA